MQARIDPYDDLDYQRFKLDEFYDDEMESYVKEARKRVSKHLNNPITVIFYTEALAWAYFENLQDSKIVFDDLGLKDLHIFAVLDMKDRFIDALDTYNNL